MADEGAGNCFVHEIGRTGVRVTHSPNLVLIVADDLGYGDLGCYGCRDIPTPHLDQLAAEGVLFRRHYAMPVCSPTRAALLTGRSPHAVGIDEALMGRGGLSPGITTLPRWFRERGYHTGLVGKWHLGYEGSALPLEQGFAEHFGHLGGKLHYYRHTDELDGLERADLWENGKPVTRPGEYSTDMFSSRACEFIAKNASRPFFLMLSYNAPHYARGIRPGEAKPAEYYLQAPPDYVLRFAADPANPSMRELYAAVVSCLDDGIGRVLAALDAFGLRDQTLALFQSDHGADAHHGGSNGMLGGFKAQLAEGGIRVPMIARFPDHLHAGAVVEVPSDVRDIWPTASSLLGLSAPRHLEGCDLSSVWLGLTAGFDRDQSFSFRQERAVIRGRWKWIADAGGQRLYDLERDPREQHDLRFRSPDVCLSLARAHKA